jgi:hypothetical protein
MTTLSNNPYGPTLRFVEFNASWVADLSCAAQQVEDERSRNKQSFDMLNHRDPYATAWARQHAAELLLKDGHDGELSDVTRAQLRSALTVAIEGKLTHKEIAALLVQDFAYSPNLSELIAHTEVGLACEYGGYINALRISTVGNRWIKKWLTSNNDDVCGVCHANAMQNWIPIDEPFASGALVPLDHAGCRCDAVYRRVRTT